jgi:predicted alpha/beta-fold hydrolase
MSIVAFATALAGGCSFSERSIPMRPNDLVQIAQTEHTTPREWLSRTQPQLSHLLGRAANDVLLTDDIVDDSGQTIDVLKHFRLSGKNLRTLLGNGVGLSHSAQAIGSGDGIDAPPPDWPGFENITIPVSSGVELSGRLGLAMRDGRTLDADCIVLLPGLFGDNAIFRTRDLAAALRANGFHALALEIRAHGQTEARDPDAYYTFGALETVDLLLVSEWLESRPHVERTGLVGFCWGANLAMLTAWYDGKPSDHPSVAENLKKRLPPVSPVRHYRAGAMAFSCVPRFEELLVEMETPVGFVRDPVLHNVQNTVRERMIRKRHPNPNHSLRTLLDVELARSSIHYDGDAEDVLRFLRFLPFRGKPSGHKLDSCRVPLLIVHGANDPLCPVQDVADLIATTDNPNVAALLLPGAGHVGFAPYARAYYFNLILSFFDPQIGAASSSSVATDTP